MPETSLRRQVLNGVLWLTLLKVLGQAITWIVTIYVMRILVPSDYGLVAMSAVYIAFITLFSEMGLSASIVQKKDLNQEDLTNIGWAVLSINVVLCSLSFVAAPFVADFYDEPRVTDLIRVASTIFIIRGLGLVPSNMLFRELKFGRLSLADLMGNVAGAVITLLLALEGFGMWSLVYGTIGSAIVSTIFCFLFFPWSPKLSFSFFKVKDMAYFGSKVAVSRLIWYLSMNMDIMIAGKILGVTQLGYYAIAVQLALIPLDKMVSTISRVAFPAMSKAQGDPAMVRQYYLKFVLVVAFASFPACWGIFLIAESAVPLFLSEKWLPAIVPLQILSMVTALRAIHTINTPTEVAIGRPDITIRNCAINLTIMASSFYIGSSFGLNGLAYSWLAFPIVFFITTSLTVRLIGLSFVAYAKELRHPFMGTGFMVLVVLLGQKLVLVNHGLAVQVAGSVTLGLVSYALYYVLFNREMFSEARHLLRR